MSYFGSKFPEGVSPDYIEIHGGEDITCPQFRITVNKSLSSEKTTYYNCDGCNTKDALIIFINLETERLFVRRDSSCTNPNIVKLPQERTVPPPDSK